MSSTTTQGKTPSNNNNNVVVTAKTYGALDTEQVKNEVWMIRIPPKLAQVWEEAPEGTHLGELVFTKGGQRQGSKAPPVKPSLEVHLTEEAIMSNSNNNKNNDDVPLHYSMEAMTKRVPVLHPFTRNRDGSITVQGTVTRTANLQMSRSDERYRQLCKNRLLQSNVTTNRFVKAVEATELSVRQSHAAAALASAEGFGSAVQQYGRRVAEANEGDGGGGADGSGGGGGRKRKYEGQPVQRVIFDLFSQQNYWTLKEMRDASGCLEKEIKHVLADIADYHRHGEHRGRYELRKEFQKQDS